MRIPYGKNVYNQEEIKESLSKDIDGASIVVLNITEMTKREYEIYSKTKEEDDS